MEEEALCIRWRGVSFGFFGTIALHTDVSLEIKYTYMYCMQGKITTTITT